MPSDHQPPSRNLTPGDTYAAFAASRERLLPVRIAGWYFVVGLLWIWLTDLALLWTEAHEVHSNLYFLLSASKGTLFVCLSTPFVYWLVRRGFLAVWRTNALLLAVTEGTTDAVFVKDRNGKYLLFNTAAARFVGKPAADVLGRDDTELFDPAGAAFVMARDREVYETGVTSTHEEEVTAAGVTRTYLATKAPYRDGHGRIVGTIGVSRDVTEWKNAQAALRENESRLAEAQQIARCGSWGWEPATGKVWWSDAVYAVFGLDRSVPPSFEAFLAVLHPDDRPRARARVEAVLGGADGFSDEFRLVRPDGTVGWIDSRARATRDASGGVVRVEGTDQDVTQQKLARSAIEASERRLRELADAIPQIVWTAAADGGLTHLNAKVTEFTGVPADDLTGWDWGRVVHPDDLDRLVGEWTAVVRTGTPQPIEFRIRRADGEYHWHIARQVPGRDETGRVVAWYGTCTDIEGLKRAEAALRDERTLLRTLIDTIPDLIAVKDTAGRHTVCNRALVAYLGASSEAELLGKTSLEIFPAADAPAYHEEDVRVARGETIHENEKVTRDAAGTPTWRSFSKTPLRDHTGAISGVVAISRNIQKRKEREQALADSRERLQLALAAARMGVWEWDVRTDAVFWSPECHAIYGGGRPAETLADFVALVHPADRDRVLASAQDSLARRGDYSAEYRIVRPDGETRWVADLARGDYAADGRPLRLVGIVQDVTDRKRAEREVEQSLSRLQATLDSTADGILVVDLEGRILDFNLQFLSLWGFPFELASAGGKRDVVASAPNHLGFLGTALGGLRDPAAFVARVEEICKSPEDSTSDVLEFRDGRILERDSRPQRIAGTPVGRVWSFRDVTARKRAEAEQQKLVRLIQHSKDFIGLADLDGRVTFLNAGARRMIGLGEDEDAGRLHMTDYVAPGWLGFFRDTALPAVREAGLWEGEMQLRHLRTGALIDVRRTTFVVRNPGGGPACFATVTRDVTEQKRAEHALRDRERLLGIVTSSARVGLVVVNDRYEYLFANEAYADIFGLTVGAVAGRRVPDLLPAVWDQLQPRLDRALAGEPVSYELSLPAVPGGPGVRWFRAMYEPREGDGGPTVVVVVVEVTDQKRAEEAIRESEERYRRLVEVLPGAVFVHTGEKVVFCNPAFIKLMGAAGPAEVIGVNPFEVAHPHYHDLIRARMGEMEQSGVRAAGVEMRVVRRDGRSVPVYSVSTPITGYGPAAFLVALSDLTERERSMDLLRSVLGSVQDPILTIDDRGTVRSANPATERTFGYAEAELLGGNVRVLMPEPYRGEHDGYIGNYLRTGAAKVIGAGREVVGRRKDGSTFPLELTVTEFRLGGERHFTGVIRDITARRKLEDQFRQAQKMEAVGQLAGGVAHDFNNLLTIINGYSDLILVAMPGGDSGRESVSAIRDAGERAARLTQQLLAFSRKAMVEPKVLDLNELVGESARLLRRLIGENIALTVVHEPSLPRIKVDPGQLEQVIMNLIVNARDAMPAGGRLSLTTRDVTVRGDDRAAHPDLKPGRYARLTVADTGAGMTDEVKGKIFEPFFTTKGVGKGTGLGLAVVHGVMKQCGGFIGVESTAGVGTTFELYFPAVADVAAGAAAGAARLAARGTETILLVEDEDAVRTIARISLEMQGFKVLEASRGAEAVRRAEEHPGTIHLLVTDVVMPEMGGRQLAEAMRGRRPGLRVLYMSGYTDDAVVHHGIVEATDAFIRKPFTPLGLARKVRAVLDATA